MREYLSFSDWQVVHEGAEILEFLKFVSRRHIFLILKDLLLG